MPDNELAQYPLNQLIREIVRRTNGKTLIYAETEQDGRDDPSSAIIYIAADSVWALGACRAIDIHTSAKYTNAYIGDDENEGENDE